MLSKTCKNSLWLFSKRKFSISTLRKMHSTSSTQGTSDPKDSTNNVFVQVLPVIPTLPLPTNRPPTDVSPPTTGGRILLCKWASGAFKDRYTGLIKALSDEERINIQNLPGSEKQKILLQIGEALIPIQLRSYVKDLELVGLLTFTDPPACDEYIYKANLTVSATEAVIGSNQAIPFGEHSCFWYNWDQIPFQEMPADDALWYPKVLWEEQKVKGTFLKGTFTFGSWSEKTIKSYELHLVNQIE